MPHRFFGAWLLFHGAIVLAFLISLAVSPKITFATSLFDILPPSSSLHEVQAADSALGAKTGRSVTILAKARLFETAKAAASALYARYVTETALSDVPNPAYFDSLSLYVDSSSVAELSAWLHDYRFALLDDETIALLENGCADELAEEALGAVYGAFTLSDLSNLSEDPFLLSETKLRALLEGGAVSSTAMSLKDDVLATQKNDAWYVLVRGTLSEKGAALASKKSTVRHLYDTTASLVREFAESGRGEIEFVFSGVPFHSYESSSSAQTQISVISTVAIVLIIVVFLWIFRSLMPALVSALAVVFSCGIGFVSTLLFFRGIHVLTFVFGTTLIGTCLDYSIHFFVNWKANAACTSGTAVRAHILRGITLGFLSTEICFVALFVAPFPLLKQVSVFLFTGLAAAYLSVVALYPRLPMPKKREAHVHLPHICVHVRFVPFILMFASLALMFVHRDSLKIRNNIQELYTMSPSMLKNEIESARVLDTGSSGWYFIVKADSEEALLQRLESLDAELTHAQKSGKLGSFLSLTQFIPSKAHQEKSYRAAEKLLPLAPTQFDSLGLGQEGALAYETAYTQAFGKHVSIVENGEHIGNLPKTLKDATENLWIGEIDGDFYACVLPLHAQSEEEAFFRAYAEQTEGVFFVNKVKDISAQLDILSKTMLLMLASAFVIVIAILFFCYKPRLVVKIALIPLCVTLVTTAVLLLCKIPLSFFPVTSLILVFGLGLDYIIYAIEGSESQSGNASLNNFAILLSFVTTALSFGALALSTFAPVHMLGLTVFVGLTAAVVTALCVTHAN